VTRPLVEILYFDGCPHHHAACELVDRVIGEVCGEAEVRLVNVADEESARRARFLGSPSIRVNGRDIEPSADARAEYVLSCRLYRTDQGFAGQPDEAWLRDALGEAPR